MHWFSQFGGAWMMILWWAVIIGAIVATVKYGSPKRIHSDERSPIDILEERYAKGEIDTKEFKEKKREMLR